MLYTLDPQKLKTFLQTLMNATGDAGSSPTNTQGKTLLQLLTEILSAQGQSASALLHASQLVANDISVGPNSTYQVGTITTPAKLIGTIHKSSGVGPNYANLDIAADDTGRMDVWTIAQANSYDITSVGIHNLGKSYMNIVTWDTTNNIYEVWHFYTSLAWKNSATFTLRNDHPTDTATMSADMRYLTI